MSHRNVCRWGTHSMSGVCIRCVRIAGDDGRADFRGQRLEDCVSLPWLSELGEVLTGKTSAAVGSGLPTARLASRAHARLILGRSDVVGPTWRDRAVVSAPPWQSTRPRASKERATWLST